MHTNASNKKLARTLQWLFYCKIKTGTAKLREPSLPNTVRQAEEATREKDIRIKNRSSGHQDLNMQMLDVSLQRFLVGGDQFGTRTATSQVRPSVAYVLRVTRTPVDSMCSMCGRSSPSAVSEHSAIMLSLNAQCCLKRSHPGRSDRG